MAAAPGWYPDPGGSTAVRYWDGSAWTTHLQMKSEQHQRPLNTFSGRRRERNLIIGLSVSLAIVAVLLVVGLVALFSPNDSTSTSDATTASPETLSGTSDQWMASICAPGKYMDGGVNLPESISEGVCVPKRGGGGVAIGKFRSSFAAENAAVMHTRANGGSYAIGTDRGGAVWIFVHPSRSGVALVDLQKFGFTLHSN